MDKQEFLRSSRSHGSFPSDVYYGRSPEEDAMYRLFGQKLIKRMLAHPELIPWGCTKEALENDLSNGYLNNRQFQEFALKAETYFQLKDAMALKGMKLFDAELEHHCSSDAVKAERAQKMITYLLEHQNLLGEDSLDAADLVNPKLISKGTLFLAQAWCFVLQQKLAGIDLYALSEKSLDRQHLAELLAPLVRSKKKGAFL